MPKQCKYSRRQFVSLSAIAAVSTITGARTIGSDVRVAAILPLSGGLRLFGEQGRIGLEVAALDINQSGGLLDRELVIDYYDDEAEPARAQSIAAGISKRADYLAVLGPITSACRDAVSPLLEDAGVPLLYATDYEGGDCGPSRFFFNSVPNQVTIPLVNHLLDQFEGGTFLLGADYVWPRRMFESCQRIIASRNRQMSGERYIPLRGLSDYSPVIDEIRESEAKILIQALPGQESEQFVAAARGADLFPNISVGVLGSVSLYTKSIRAIAGIQAFGCSPFLQTERSPAVMNFVMKARRFAPYGVSISAYAATHCNALKAMARACMALQDVSRKAVISGLAGLEYETPTGKLQIDAATHHTSLKMHLAKIGAEGANILGPPELIYPDRACTVGGVAASARAGAELSRALHI